MLFLVPSFIPALVQAFPLVYLFCYFCAGALRKHPLAFYLPWALVVAVRELGRAACRIRPGFSGLRRRLQRMAELDARRVPRPRHRAEPLHLLGRRGQLLPNRHVRRRVREDEDGQALLLHPLGDVRAGRNHHHGARVPCAELRDGIRQPDGRPDVRPSGGRLHVHRGRAHRPASPRSPSSSPGLPRSRRCAAAWSPPPGERCRSSPTPSPSSCSRRGYSWPWDTRCTCTRSTACVCSRRSTKEAPPSCPTLPATWRAPGSYAALLGAYPVLRLRRRRKAKPQDLTGKTLHEISYPSRPSGKPTIERGAFMEVS